jgi:hypothetical protein
MDMEKGRQMTPDRVATVRGNGSFPDTLPAVVARSGLTLLALVFWAGAARAQPAPGDVFREYTWVVPDRADNEPHLRVGGRLDYRKQVPDLGEGNYRDGAIRLTHAVDLDGAIRAEIQVEKVLSHAGTTGLAVRVNESEWIPFPEAAGIPAPQSDFYHHTFPAVPVPLGALRPGEDNFFSLRVDPEHPWDWPQNLLYGVILRVYYEEGRARTRGRIVTLAPGDRLTDSVTLGVEVPGGLDRVRRVDYVGLYEDVNLEGDGRYRQWHHVFSDGEISGHIGTSHEAPFEVSWETGWIPDQAEPMEVAARIVDRDGVVHITPAVGGLSLDRGFSVELCKPTDIPRLWVTRSGSHTSTFHPQGDLEKAVEFQLVWNSWSPGYFNGILLNDYVVFAHGYVNYRPRAYYITSDAAYKLESGANFITTRQTPKKHGTEMVHGAEVQYPGVMVLIRYAGR